MLRTAALFLVILVGFLVPADPAAAAQPDFFRTYTLFDLAECLDRFTERELFEAMHARVFVEKTAADYFTLALLHHHGFGTPRDAAAAVRWYREAAAAGYRFGDLGDETDQALMELSAVLEDTGEPPDSPPTPTSATVTAAEMRRQSERHWRGLGASLDWEAARDWLLRSAEAGDREAMAMVAVRYADGIDAFPRDIAASRRWYLRLAEEGEAADPVFLGDAYRDGDGVERDPVRAAALYREAGRNGSLTGWLRLRDLGRSDPALVDEDTAAEIDRHLDLQQQAVAASTAGTAQPLAEYADSYYHKGLAVYAAPEPDFLQAGLFFADAAGLGTTIADNHFLLGWIQEFGLAGEVNPYGAGKSYRHAALLGHGPASVRLAALYAAGRGLRRSAREALRWYEVAAAAGEDVPEELVASLRQEVAAATAEEWDTPAFRQLVEKARYRASFKR